MGIDKENKNVIIGNDFYIVLMSSFVAFALTVLVIKLMKPVAIHLGMVDKPDVRKKHSGEIPLIGGLAIFISYIITSFVLNPQFLSVDVFFVASALLIIVGIIDDKFSLSTRIRFSAQIIAALIMILSGHVVLNDLGALSFDGSLLALGILSIPFTVFATVGIINAVNMSDGIDGLAGSYVLVVLIGLSVAGQLFNNEALSLSLLFLMAALAAFLVFNYGFLGKKSATIFMGDTGSTFLGFALVWFILTASQGENRFITPVSALWFMMMPLFDTVGIMLRRIIKGRSPFTADREHFHHVLLLAGFSVNQSLFILVALSFLGMSFGLLGLYYQISEFTLFIGFLALFALYFNGMQHAWKVMRFLKWSICRRKGVRLSAAHRRV